MIPFVAFFFPSTLVLIVNLEPALLCRSSVMFVTWRQGLGKLLNKVQTGYEATGMTHNHHQLKLLKYHDEVVPSRHLEH